MDASVCRIQDARGRREPCPGAPCPFRRDDTCVVAGLRADLGRTPGLPELLLLIRGQLAGDHATGYGLPADLSP